MALVVKSLLVNARDDTWFKSWVGKTPGGGHGKLTPVFLLRIQVTEAPGELQFIGSQTDTTEAT